ncbi:hypothetical protein A9L43_22435 [Pseudomonas mosselii]|uniref:hypothetical protein n=1 Tax=Pseudomonas mosselii TaxID=78327 RepID=UPI00083E193F|nr:hypothetical protein [Pseudomonas mosselii]ODB37729.1 hypothetical protein A9L43_22435 [Pseudomonas mosselii]
MVEKWFERAIVAGFQGLVALRLDGAPAADAVTKTLDIWLIALTKNREWDEAQDTARIRETFETLFSSCEKWPSPARFLRDLKPRELPPGLPKPERTDEQLKTGNVALDGIVARLRGRVAAQRVTILKTNRQFEYSRQAAGLIATAEQQRADQQTNTEQHN